MPVDLPQLDSQIESDLDDLWQVVLLDDDHHTYDYVIEMLMELFGHSEELAYKMACEVDSEKRVIVDVADKTSAEKKKRSIETYGSDWRMQSSLGSMSAVIEPAS